MQPIIVNRFTSPALDKSILLKFSMKTSLESKSFEPLADFLLNTLGAGVRYIRTSISAEKTAVFGCLTNALAPLPIALESC